MRRAIKPNRMKAQSTMAARVPAPVGGWNARDALDAMGPQDAVTLDNFVPRAGYVELRRGYVQTVAGFASPVETLIPYRGGASGTDKLFAASGGKIYDGITTPLGAALISGLSNNRWNYTLFANSAGAWTICCNGADAPIGYNAAAWAALPALSGSSGGITLVPTTLFNVFGHKGRLFYLQQSSLYVWIPAAGAVGGACTLLDLSSIFTKGGRLVAGATWSYQYGLDSDDFAVFVTDQGQVALYQGVDPTNASAWSLVGIFDLGVPLGPRALLRFGGDLALVTTDGIIALSQALRLDRAQQEGIAITSKIMQAFGSAVRAYQSNYGWQGLFYPGASASNMTDAAAGGLAIFNVPISTLGTSEQFVQNVLTGAWARFLNLNAFCWEMANGNVYFGTTAAVCQWDTGSQDNGTAISGVLQGAFSAFGQPGRAKRFHSVRPLLNCPGIVAPALDINTDYDTTTLPTAVASVLDQSSTTPELRYDWTSASGEGFVGSPIMTVTIQGSPNAQNVGTGDVAGDLVAINVAGDTLLAASNLPFDVPFQVLGFDVLFQPGAIIG